MLQNTVQNHAGQCSGCGACAERCPVKAIIMKRDDEGFLTPVIDKALCTDCGRCRDICPMTRPGNYKEEREPEFYVGIHASGDVLSRSTSGGAFTALSDAILARGGVVYGVDFDEDLMVCHKRAVNEEQRDRMRFSKYIQSRPFDCYAQIEADLDAGKTVLFTGTPCQTAAVRALFGQRDNLILCDLICHGVASPLLWEEYRRALADEQGAPVNWVSFRSKAKGWFRGQYQIYYTVQGGAEQLEDTRFFELYLRGCYLLRPSCHACPYGDTHRAADLTIADYWGIEKFSEKWCDRRGVSLIMTHTEKGKKLLESCERFPHEKRDSAEALAEQKRLHGPVAAPEDRSLFWELLRERGFAEAYRQMAEKHPEVFLH